MQIFKRELQEIRDEGLYSIYKKAIRCVAAQIGRSVDSEQIAGIMVGLYDHDVDADELKRAVKLMLSDRSFRDRCAQYRTPLMASDFIEAIEFIPIHNKTYTPEQKNDIVSKLGSVPGQFVKTPGGRDTYHYKYIEEDG